jgi:hypothetical protein
MESKMAKAAHNNRHVINFGEHECNAERIPSHRLQAYFKGRPKLTLKSQKVKDWSAKNED